MNTGIAKNRHLETRYVKHVFPGQPPLYELQTWSTIRQKWYVTTSGTYRHCETFAFRHCYPIAKQPLVCKHEAV